MLLDLRPPTMDGSPLEEGQDVSRPCMPLSPVLEMPPEYPDEDTNLVPCSICNRTFNPVSLQRHEKVCEKLQTKKRKAFDSTKQRQEGIDTTGGSVSSRDKKSAPIPKAKSRWREKHKEFLKTIRAAKSTSDDENDGDQKNIPSDYIQCIHCERHFGPKAAERHISWCSEQKNRLSRNHTNEDVEAAQRLKTRTKYTPPKPGQSGWRAPKRKDVISSIPPPNVGANITPPGRLISPPPPTNSSRHVSPPPAHLPPQRHWSPPSVNLSRRNTINSLPPGPPRYGGGTSSLGRSAGKQLAAMIQSISDHHPNYGYPAGSGPSTLYGGSISGSSTPNYGQHQYFNRSASLKLPRRRPAGGTRMARHRDLAMDMLASVSVDGTKAKREEPEGDESHDMTRSKEHFRYNKLEKEKMNEQRKKDRSAGPSRLDEEDYMPEHVNVDYLNLEYIRSKRKALDEEIRKLAGQLQTSVLTGIDGKETGSEKASREDLDDTGFNELDYPNYESEDEELDIPTEENFLKSSTSASGDDDINDITASRPRSVHFEDEYWNDSQFVSDYDFNSSSGNTSGTSHVWSGGGSECPSGDLTSSTVDFQSEPFLMKLKVPPLKSPNKESVREILRKRREESGGNQADLDGRRRVQSLQQKPQERTNMRSRSRSKEYRQRTARESKSAVRSSISLENCSSISYLEQQRHSRSAKHIGPKISLNSSGSRVEPVISRKEYAQLKSLVGSKGVIKEVAKNQRPTMRLKVVKMPKEYSAGSGRHEDKSYDPYSAAELQFQDLLGPSKSGVGLRAGMMMGSTGSLLSLPLSRRYSVERDFSPPKRSSLRGLGSISLCSFGLDSMDLTTREGKLNGDDSSELESLGGSSHGLRSPENELDDLLASPTSEHHPQSTQLFGNDSFNRKSLSRSNSRSRTVSSQSIRLPFDTAGNTDRKVPDGSYSFSKSPSPSYNFEAYRRSTSVEKTPPLYQPSKERSPSPYQLSKEHSPSPYQPLKERSPSPYLPSKEQTSMLFHTFKERSPLAYHSTKEQSSRLYSTSKERSPSPFQTSKNATSPPYPIPKERSPSPFQSKGPMSPPYHNSKERSPPYNSSKEPMSPSYHTSKERSPFTYHSSKEQSSSPYQTSKERSPSPFYTSKEQSPTPYNPPKERSPSPFYTSKEQSPTPYNPPKERTPQPYQNSLGSTSDFKKTETPSSSYGNTHSFGWTASEQSGSPQSYSRYFGSKPQSEGNSSSKTTPSYSTTSYESLKALRACLDEDNKSQKTMMHRLDESMQRVSSGSSTDSSLPPLSSPVPPPASTTRAQPINPTSGGSFAMPKFCYECGNKYPILQARFCCQCGAPRVTVND